MYPVASEGIRKLKEDMVLQGYKIPKGANVAMSTALLQRESKYFANPDNFIPERWLKGERHLDNVTCPHTSVTNAFAYLPFGYGPRSCIGRRFAELEIANMTIRMVRTFELSWHYGELSSLSTFVNSLVGDMKFRLKEVEQ